MVGRVGGFLIAVALAGSAAGPALGSVSTSSSADLFEGVRGKIRAGLSEHGVPSMSIAVARDGKIIWEEAFGFADVERRVKAFDSSTPRTMYSLASISKPFTATGLMILVERGLVDLDRPLNDYLDTFNFPANKKLVLELARCEFIDRRKDSGPGGRCLGGDPAPGWVAYFGIAAALSVLHGG